MIVNNVELDVISSPLFLAVPGSNALSRTEMKYFLSYSRMLKKLSEIIFKSMTQLIELGLKENYLRNSSRSKYFQKPNEFERANPF